MRYCKQICHRCGAEADSLRASWFNLHMLCHSCLTEEANHPMYEQAQKTEFTKNQTGNYRFEGIGLPDDLQRKYYLSKSV